MNSRWREIIEQKFRDQFGFRMKEITFTKIVKYLHEPKDSSSLAVTRILFGLCMLLDIPDERGGANMDERWGNPQLCHFPLLPFLTAVPMPWMAVIYAALWIGALGIMLGYNYRLSCVLFTTSHWYLLLIEKSFWNNHSYLFGLLGLLMTFTQAHCFWSIDAYLDPSIRSTTVPYWNYFLLKYQLFILYFVAGLKKATPEWLSGYSVPNLAEHWLFEPLKLFLTVKQIDYFIVHWYIFVFDLTIAVWMMWAPTRSVAMVPCAMFHLMNSRLFSIGMFPWVCLATMPLFYPFDWPKRVYRNIKAINCMSQDSQILTDDKEQEVENEISSDVEIDDEEAMPLLMDTNDDSLEESSKYEYDEYNTNYQEYKEEEFVTSVTKRKFKDANEIVEDSTVYTYRDSKDLPEKVMDEPSNDVDLGRREKFRTIAIIFYVFLQAFLPYSHFITKGYNNWTNGLYGYSWDMMVHSWDPMPFAVKLVDRESGEEMYVEPLYHTVNDRWTRHGDMVYQYAHCLKDSLRAMPRDFGSARLSANISIHVDIWYALNGRFTQRMFDSKMDILAASWSIFERIPFLMPLLDEALDWRSFISEMKDEVKSWGNKTELFFYADFPGYDQEKFISPELKNITLTILDGRVGFQAEKSGNGMSYLLLSGDRMDIQSGAFHTVKIIGTQPAYYMYMFTNTTTIGMDSISKPKLPIAKELYIRFEKMRKFANLVFTNIFLCFSKCRCI